MNPALPPDVNAVIEKALHKDPQRRYPTGAAFIGGLRKAFAMLPPDTLSRPPLQAWPECVLHATAVPSAREKTGRKCRAPGRAK